MQMSEKQKLEKPKSNKPDYDRMGDAFGLPTGAGEAIVRLVESADSIHDRLDKAEYAANHDKLTGLLNSGGFEIAVDALQQESDPDAKAALVVIDFNDFKSINDNYGHLAGNKALV